jgi:geranylgeranyl diphosphate synthase type II
MEPSSKKPWDSNWMKEQIALNAPNDAPEYLRKVAAAVDGYLAQLLPSPTTYPSSIHSLMHYSIFAGGKRIRPGLIMAAYEACGGSFGDEKPLLAGAAFEMLHTFSLIHDDLPCMDDDDFRRGKPTAHRAFNEALAVLGGDALCIFAFECLTRTGQIDLIRETAQALGTSGMIGGQVADVESEGREVDEKAVEYIHRNKTAAFIRASVRTGGLLASASPFCLEHLGAYGDFVGLAFQIIDDILDEEGTTQQLGKDAGSDREKGKATFPSVIGMTESKRRAKQLVRDACAEADALGSAAATLKVLAEFVGSRLY